MSRCSCAVLRLPAGEGGGKYCGVRWRLGEECGRRRSSRPAECNNRNSSQGLSCGGWASERGCETQCRESVGKRRARTSAVAYKEGVTGLLSRREGASDALEGGIGDGAWKQQQTLACRGGLCIEMRDAPVWTSARDAANERRCLVQGSRPWFISEMQVQRSPSSSISAMHRDRGRTWHRLICATTTADATAASRPPRSPLRRANTRTGRGRDESGR